MSWGPDGRGDHVVPLGTAPDVNPARYSSFPILTPDTGRFPVPATQCDPWNAVFPTAREKTPPRPGGVKFGRRRHRIANAPPGRIMPRFGGKKRHKTLGYPLNGARPPVAHSGDQDIRGLGTQVERRRKFLDFGFQVGRLFDQGARQFGIAG